MSKGQLNSGSARTIGEVASKIVANLKFRRQVIRLRQQGDSVLGEVLDHIGAKHGIQTSIEQTVDRFAEIEPEVLEAASAEKFCPAPLHEVGDG